MTEAEHLWVVLGEEAAEVQQAVAKILRFGPHDGYPGTGRLNLNDTITELNQLLAVTTMLIECGALPRDWINFEVQKEKRMKVASMMRYAVKQGTLQMNEPNDLHLSTYLQDSDSKTDQGTDRKV